MVYPFVGDRLDTAPNIASGSGHKNNGENESLHSPRHTPSWAMTPFPLNYFATAAASFFTPKMLFIPPSCWKFCSRYSANPGTALRA